MIEQIEHRQSPHDCPQAGLCHENGVYVVRWVQSSQCAAFIVVAALQVVDILCSIKLVTASVHACTSIKMAANVASHY